uniref:Cap-specific mRNA (nucleoside-2'-O-)-methyltransferase 2 n=2 Tax=Wuchereria bancrofti TaxID=6293 RepID=A0AAF5PKK0_WUCBA
MAEIEQLKSIYGQVVASLFSKHMRLKPLPTDESSNTETNEELMSQLWDLSYCLNELRETIPSDHIDDWRRHTSFTHPLRSFIRKHAKSAYSTEYSTQAFFKFYEILVRFSHLCFPCSDAKHIIRSFHLCESPGAFISALNVYLILQKNKRSWQWYANSLNPHYEWNSPFDMFLDDELITSTSSNWLFGPDNSGDVLKWTSEYISGIAKKVGKFSLITADGSVYCQDNPAEQERIIFPLLQKEIDISLSLLQTNGTFIVKMYTAFLNDTVTLLNRLLMCFHEVHVIKPSCSKPGNSEVYLLCASYTPCEQHKGGIELFTSCRKILLECSKFFVKHQMQMIWFNIATFGKIENDLKKFIEQKKIQAAGIYQQMMTISNFEKFAAELFSSSFTLLKRPNPWRFSKLGGFIEGLRNITIEEAHILIENMMVCDFMNGNNVAAEQKFDISLCWMCDSCQWVGDFCVNKRNLEEILEMGDAAPETNIKHTLFLEPKILALLKCASLEILDICSIVSSSAVNLSLERQEMLLQRNSHLEISSSILRSQFDWISILEEMFFHASNYQDLKVQIKIPSSSLMLTRFTVSFMAFCCLCYESVVLLCPDENSQLPSNQLICCSPRKDVDRCAQLLRYLSVIRARLLDVVQDGSRIYRFVPECQFRCEHFYSSILRYNSFMARRMFTKCKF